MEAQYGTDADEAWFAGRVMAVNVDGTCDVHYEDGDKEAGKPWSRVRAAAVDAESGKGGELGGEVEEGILGGQSTFEVEAIAALAWCGEGSVRVHPGRKDSEMGACSEDSEDSGGESSEE